MTRAEPHAAASAPGSSRPAAAPAPSARAGSRSASGVSAPARESAATAIRLIEARQKPPSSAAESARDAQDERERQRDRAIGADPAVAHDVELHRPRRAAAKTVGDVGETILVQGAGRGDERGRRQAGAKEMRQADEARRAPAPARPTRPTVAPATGAAQAKRLRSSGALGARADGHASEKAKRVADVARSGSKATGRISTGHIGDLARIDRCGSGGERRADIGGAAQITHMNRATATSPSPVRPVSTRPHCRTSARAAATSGPRKLRIWLSSGDMTKNA